MPSTGAASTTTTPRVLAPARQASSRPRRATAARSVSLAPDNVLDISQLRRQRALETEWSASQSLQPESAGRIADDLPRANTPARPQAAPRPACAPCHWGLIAVTLLMALLSIPVVYSASQAIALDNHGNTDYFLIRQIGFVLAGLGLLVGASRLPVRSMRSGLWVLYFLSIIGLLAIEFTPLGVTMGGVQRWLRLGPIPFQVSEIAKIALIGVLADFWSRAAVSSRRAVWPWLAAFGIALPMIGLVFKQPHLSATLVLFSIPVIIGFYAGAPMKQLGVLFGGLSICGALVIGLCAVKKMPMLPMYQQERIAHFLSKETDERGAHYQSEQGLHAIARGGLLGAGPGGSLFKQGHLPAPHTDFILAIIGEETGLAGMLFLLASYGAMIFFCFQIGHVSGKPFESLLCAGVGSLLALQVLCNMSVVLNILPVTGMPLPMVSYGGTGLISCLLALGLVLGVSRQSGEEKKAA
jgi:cell division protein FtsW